MERRLDAEKALTNLANIYAEQNGQSCKRVSITRRVSNEEIYNSVNSGYFSR